MFAWSASVVIKCLDRDFNINWSYMLGEPTITTMSKSSWYFIFSLSCVLSCSSSSRSEHESSTLFITSFYLGDRAEKKFWTLQKLLQLIVLAEHVLGIEDSLCEQKKRWGFRLKELLAAGFEMKQYLTGWNSRWYFFNSIHLEIWVIEDIPILTYKGHPPFIFFTSTWTVRVICFTFPVKPALLGEKLTAMQAEPSHVSWMWRWMCHDGCGRQQYVRLQQCVSDTVVSNTRDPQGPPLPLFLFTLYLPSATRQGHAIFRSFLMTPL